MKKNLLWMLVTILICGLTTVSMSSCSKDDNDGGKEGEPSAIVGMKVKYYVKIDSQSTLDACNVTVEYTDANGKIQSQTLTSLNEFSPEPVTIKGLPNRAEMKLTIAPKDGWTGEKYDVEATYGIGAAAVDAKGNIKGDIGITPEAITSKGIKTEAKRTFTRTKLATINANGEVDVD
jgi:hypothetical protein